MSGSEKPEFSDALAVGRALDLTLPGERRAETIWDAIALHTSSSIGQFKGVDVSSAARSRHATDLYRAL